MAQIQISEYEKALDALDEAMGLMAKSAEGSAEWRAFRDSCIQRFEFCVELAWKVGKRLLGTSSSAPRSVIREMAQDQLIEAPEIWFEFIEARNKSSHTYDEDVAKAVFQVVQSFPPQARALLTLMKKK